jgi:hypothetical protein
MATDQRSLRVAAGNPPPGSARAAKPAPSEPAVIEHDSNHDAEHTCEACEQIRAAMAGTDAPVQVEADAPVEVEANAQDATELAEAEPEVIEPEATVVAEPAVAEPELAETEAPEADADWVLPADPIVAVATKAPKVQTAPTVPTVPTAPAAANPPAGPRKRRWLLLLVGALVVAIVAAVVVAIVLNKKSSSTAAKPSAAPTSAAAGASTAPGSAGPQSGDVTAAIAWARQQLQLSSTLLADAPTAAALKAVGFTVVSADDLRSAGVNAPAFEYLVDTPALRQLAVTTPAASAALSAAVPVALFGPADNQVAIRQAVLDSATVVSARQAADEKFRATAEAELLRNPAIHSSGNAAAALQSASLDLRAATVLAYVANSSNVQFANVTASAPETAAGLPIRSIDIKVTSQAVMQTIISGLPIAYQPSSVTTISGGAVRMVWPITAEPLPSLS